MLINEPFGTRADGVNLFINIDALTDEKGEVVRDKDKKPIPRGYYILQNETGAKLDAAIDVENAPYTYAETDEPIEKVAETEEV